MKYGRKIMDMDKEELYLVYSAINKLNYPKHDVEEVQEEVIKWLLDNKLSLKHIFYFYQDDDDTLKHKYLLSRNSETPCHCCSTIPITYDQFKNDKNSKLNKCIPTKREEKNNYIEEDGKTDVNNVSKQQVKQKSDIVLSPNELIKRNENYNITKSGITTSKITPIIEQPKIGEHLRDDNNVIMKKKNFDKRDDGCCLWCSNFCTTCKAEFGKCCIDILGNI